MKKIITLLVLLNSVLAYGQDWANAKKFFVNTREEVIFLGIDYSNVKLVDVVTNKGNLAVTLDQMNGYFKQWNDLIINEKKKYNIAEAFKREQVLYIIDSIEVINRNASTENMIASRNPFYSKDMIQKQIANYDYGVNSGFGILFVAEALNMKERKLTLTVVTIDLSTKEPMFVEKIEGEPGGSGFRNYWANAIYRIIEEIGKTHYKAWYKYFVKGK